MTVVVEFIDKHGNEASESFDSEYRAGIFINGLNQRDDSRFGRVDYPDMYDEPRIR